MKRTSFVRGLLPLACVVLVGLVGTSAAQTPILPSESMPNYPETSLSDDEARDLYACVRTFADNAPALEDIPTLNAIIESAAEPFSP